MLFQSRKLVRIKVKIYRRRFEKPISSVAVSTPPRALVRARPRIFPNTVASVTGHRTFPPRRSLSFLNCLSWCFLGDFELFFRSLFLGIPAHNAERRRVAGGFFRGHVARRIRAQGGTAGHASVVVY